MHDGSSKIARRDGMTSQLWLTRAFLNDSVTLGVGAGSYRFSPNWDARLE